MNPQHIVSELPLAPTRCEILPAIHRTPDMSPMNNSVHPLDPVLPLQPPKQQGCCGRLTDKLCCKSCRGGGKLCCCFKTPACCGKLCSRLGSLCSRLNCCKKLSCSCCKKNQDNPQPQPQRKSRLRECLSRLNCLRWSKCCKKTQPQPQQQDEDLEEGSVGCCAGCKGRCKRCYRGLFCLNRACCQRLRNCCRCDRLACCRMGGCCGPTPTQLDRRKSRMSVRRSQSSITQGMPKLDPTLVEHQSMMRGAVPVLPLPLAWMCCILNVFLPGSGTLLSGVFCLCFGKPRFSVNDSYPSRLTAFLINLVVSVSQLFTVLFCLVGWGWSIWWGVMMVKFARKQKRILLAEKNAEQPAAVAVNQNHDTERAR
ncbi:hypothetical protein J6590_071019 [Homalodisca vitripennis]|nr:hypothetical protein J6590_071019 [Homalodisca vitripennis]